MRRRRGEVAANLRLTPMLRHARSRGRKDRHQLTVISWTYFPQAPFVGPALKGIPVALVIVMREPILRHGDGARRPNAYIMVV